MALSRTLVERRNYEKLKWNKPYNEYYHRDWRKETLQYLSDKIKTNNKAFTTNWKFNVYKNTELAHIPALRGHSLSDIGESIIFIGDRKRKTRVDIYKMNKYLNKLQKLSANGPSPCCRFHHSANYIPPINSILFFGGFDSQCNFNDAWLLSLSSNNLSWHHLTYNAEIEYRAYHSSTSRMLKNKFEIYIFGGQFCNNGPYEYHNDIFKFTFHNINYIGDEEKKQEETFGYFECEELQVYGRKPCARSMSHSWIVGNTYYIFGGSVAHYTLNDLWALDLNTNIWTQISYNGILKAPPTETIEPKDFRVIAKRKPCFFEKKLNELIVIHYGELSEIQKEFMCYEYDDTLNEFEYRMELRIKTKSNEKQKRLKSMKWPSPYHIFRFDLGEKKWYIERNNIINDEYEKGDLPSKLIASTRIVRIGEYLIQMGGGYKNSRINYMKHLYFLKIPNSKVRKTMSWSRERLIWIAHYHDVAIFNKCPKDIISLIISFLNPKNTI